VGTKAEKVGKGRKGQGGGGKQGTYQILTIKTCRHTLRVLNDLTFIYTTRKHVESLFDVHRYTTFEENNKALKDSH
jgi:hypothetical protein